MTDDNDQAPFFANIVVNDGNPEMAPWADQDSLKKSARITAINNPWIPNELNDELLNSTKVPRDYAEAICRLRAAILSNGNCTFTTGYGNSHLFDNGLVEMYYEFGNNTIAGINALKDVVAEFEPLEGTDTYLECEMMDEAWLTVPHPSKKVIPYHLILRYSGRHARTTNIYATVDGEIRTDSLISYHHRHTAESPQEAVEFLRDVIFHEDI